MSYVAQGSSSNDHIRAGALLKTRRMFTLVSLLSSASRGRMPPLPPPPPRAKRLVLYCAKCLASPLLTEFHRASRNSSSHFSALSVCTIEKKHTQKVKIQLRVHLAHAQSGWLSFLNRIKHELEIEDIDGVYEDANGAPVVRIASLVDDGLYFVRPTEV